ncbi:tRNA (adenosine(37)-N6)-threonylcarbamoyltransferase complex transferase subunit TsaD [Candidatus Saccharibacteria bacterium]|nr:tRNA (adenosine(37)-N6)-threonylcarbamoyltransferase complex transferase subunit TsaD [Candidatus Saccharibacteria bacterium]
MKILGIESSCDETAASVVEDGHKLLSNVIASSVDMHAVYGGVVPEIASRSHLEVILPTIEEALETAQTSWSSIDAIAVTVGPGLSGSLLIGCQTAASLAVVKNIPLYAINHVEAHVYANFLTRTDLAGYSLPSSPPRFPLLALIVSGGHTQLVLFTDHFNYKLLGQTTDDAVGEAFDKVAKMLGLPYPGGPSIAKAAENGNSDAIKLPIARKERSNPLQADARQGAGEQRTEAYLRYGEGAAEPATQRSAATTDKAASYARPQDSRLQGLGPYDFSFSGLKTAVLRAAQQMVGKDYTLPSSALPKLLTKKQKVDIAASFQRAAIDTLIIALEAAAKSYSPKSIVIAGGVAANIALRDAAHKKLGKNVYYPDIKLCTDNAAMIACLGYYKASKKLPAADPYSIDIDSNLSM